MAIAGKVAITPKGEWNSAENYGKLDAVSYNNSLFIAKKASTGVTPIDGDTWMLAVQSTDTAEIEKIINGTTVVKEAEMATKDGFGNIIPDTYTTKIEAENFQTKTGNTADNTVEFTSIDTETAEAWTDVLILKSGEKHSSIFNKISTMFKNIRYIYSHFIDSSNILDTLEEISTNTQPGKVAGALVLKEVNSNLNDIKTIDVLCDYLNSGNSFKIYKRNGLCAFALTALSNLPINTTQVIAVIPEGFRSVMEIAQNVNVPNSTKTINLSINSNGEIRAYNYTDSTGTINVRAIFNYICSD